MDLPIAQIDMPRILLRDVRTDSVEYAELRNSISKPHGVLNSVLVRPMGDRFELVDGAYRLTVCKELGHETIPAISRELTDEEVLAIQIETNAVFMDTTTMEYARHLLRIQQAYPNITMPQLGKLVSKRAHWLKQQLELLKLDPKIQPMVDRGEISVMNAYKLAKLPPHIQRRHLKEAMIMPHDEFKTLVAEIIQQLQMNQKERAEEKRMAEQSAELHPFLRDVKTIKKELATNRQAALLIASQRPKTHLDAFRLALEWAMNIDPLTAAVRRGRAAEDSFSNLEES